MCNRFAFFLLLIFRSNMGGLIYTPCSFFINYHIKRNRSHRVHKKTIQSKTVLKLVVWLCFFFFFQSKKWPYFSHSVFKRTIRKIIFRSGISFKRLPCFREHICSKKPNSTWKYVSYLYRQNIDVLFKFSYQLKNNFAANTGKYSVQMYNLFEREFGTKCSTCRNKW